MRGLHLPLINISHIMVYRPLSKNTAKNRYRLQKLSDIANERGIDTVGLMEDFAIYLATVIKWRLRDAVRMQIVNGKSMKRLYKPLSSAYAKRKTSRNRDKFWIDTGFIINNLRVYRAGRRGDIYIGFPRNVRHPKSKVKLYNIIRWLEYGTKKQPARPLLKPVVTSVAKNIAVYFNHYITYIRKV